jgi:hypothetical protein
VVLPAPRTRRLKFNQAGEAGCKPSASDRPSPSIGLIFQPNQKKKEKNFQPNQKKKGKETRLRDRWQG